MILGEGEGWAQTKGPEQTYTPSLMCRDSGRVLAAWANPSQIPEIRLQQAWIAKVLQPIINRPERRPRRGNRPAPILPGQLAGLDLPGLESGRLTGCLT